MCRENVDVAKIGLRMTISLPSNIPEIEICIDARTPEKTEEEVRAAYLGGADRIELCDDMKFGGTTPQQQCIKIARDLFPGRNGIIVMIRPRGGNFFFSLQEITQMHKAIDTAAKSGANGVALGALHPPEGHISTEVLSELITRAHSANLTVTLHRAFDAISDQEKAIEWAANIGVKRILTSGTPWEISKGPAHNLHRLQEISILANGQIEIVAAGGINLSCAKQIATGLADLPSPFSLHIFSGVRVSKKLNLKRIQQIRKKLTNA